MKKSVNFTYLPNPKAQKIPAGTYYVGDPCYIIPDEMWSDYIVEMFDEKGGSLGPIFCIQYKQYRTFVFDTAYGDGQYPISVNGVEMASFGVDAGCYSLIPAQLVQVFGGNMSSGCKVTFNSEAHIESYEKGDAFIVSSDTKLFIDTSGNDDEEEEEDNWEDEDDYNSYGDDDEDELDEAKTPTKLDALINEVVQNDPNIIKSSNVYINGGSNNDQQVPCIILCEASSNINDVLILLKADKLAGECDCIVICKKIKEENGTTYWADKIPGLFFNIADSRHNKFINALDRIN